MAGKTSTLRVEVISPESALFMREVHEARLPTEDGDIGVFPGHAKLITVLRPGLIGFYNDLGKAEEEYFVEGGFADITPERCSVMIKSAIRRSQLNASDVARERETLQAEHKAAQTEGERSRIERQLGVVTAKEDALLSK